MGRKVSSGMESQKWWTFITIILSFVLGILRGMYITYFFEDELRKATAYSASLHSVSPSLFNSFSVPRKR